MSGDLAESPVMKEMDDSQGLIIIRDASNKHIQPLTLADVTMVMTTSTSYSKSRSLKKPISFDFLVLQIFTILPYLSTNET